MSSSAKYPNEVTERAEVQATDYFIGYRPGSPSALSRWSGSVMQAWFEGLVGFAARPLPTGYTGGASTDIHSVATVALPAGTIILTPNMPAGERQWQVKAGTVTEDLDQLIVVPSDAHPTTNAKYLQAF
jgi:hypothetical protein